MSIVVDIIILAILALFTFLGYHRGLIKVAFKIITFFAAIIITLILFKPISNIIIEKTEIDENIENTIIQNFSNNEEEEIKEEDLENLPQIISNKVKEYTKEAQNTTVKEVSKKISEITINIVVAIAIFLITKLLLILFKFLSEKISEMPVIKQFDKTGGTIYGILEGALIIYGILAILTLIAPMIEELEIINQINKSYIGSYLYNNNIILKIFS